MSRIKEIGSVDVDSGTLIIIDPCYLIDHDKWDQFIKENDPENKLFDKDVLEVKGGLWVTGWGGDGTYRVYAERDLSGVRKIIIDFTGEENEDE